MYILSSFRLLFSCLVFITNLDLITICMFCVAPSAVGAALFSYWTWNLHIMKLGWVNRFLCLLSSSLGICVILRKSPSSSCTQKKMISVFKMQVVYRILDNPNLKKKKKTGLCWRPKVIPTRTCTYCKSSKVMFWLVRSTFYYYKHLIFCILAL